MNQCNKASFNLYTIKENNNVIRGKETNSFNAAKPGNVKIIANYKPNISPITGNSPTSKFQLAESHVSRTYIKNPAHISKVSLDTFPATPSTTSFISSIKPFTNFMITAPFNRIEVQGHVVNKLPWVIDAVSSATGINVLWNSFFMNKAKSFWFEAQIVDISFNGPLYNLHLNPKDDQDAKLIDKVGNSRAEYLIVKLINTSTRLLPDVFKVPLESSRLVLNPNENQKYVPRARAYAEVRIKLLDCFAWVLCFVHLIQNFKAYVQLIGSENQQNFYVASQMHVAKISDLREVSLKRKPLNLLGGVVCRQIHITLTSIRNLVTQGNLHPSIIQKSCNLLKTVLVFQENLRMLFVGTPLDIANAIIHVEYVLKPTKQPETTHETKYHRFQYLSRRRELYNKHCVQEFYVDEDNIDLVIGRQGRKLSYIANLYQVELRLLPSYNGLRLIQIYGRNMKSVQNAHSQLALLYQKMKIEWLNESPTIHLYYLKILATKSGVFSLWVDETKNEFVLLGSQNCLETFISCCKELLYRAK